MSDDENTIPFYAPHQPPAARANRSPASYCSSLAGTLIATAWNSATRASRRRTS